MARSVQGTVVEVGDVVVVEAQGMRVKGRVEVVDYWGEEYGWDLELADANVRGGYSRWKQGTDGGKLVEVNGRTV